MVGGEKERRSKVFVAASIAWQQLSFSSYEFHHRVFPAFSRDPWPPCWPQEAGAGDKKGAEEKYRRKYEGGRREI